MSTPRQSPREGYAAYKQAARECAEHLEDLPVGASGPCSKVFLASMGLGGITEFGETLAKYDLTDWRTYSQWIADIIEALSRALRYPSEYYTRDVLVKVYWLSHCLEERSLGEKMMNEEREKHWLHPRGYSLRHIYEADPIVAAKRFVEELSGELDCLGRWEMQRRGLPVCGTEQLCDLNAASIEVTQPLCNVEAAGQVMAEWLRTTGNDSLAPLAKMYEAERQVSAPWVAGPLTENEQMVLLTDVRNFADYLMGMRPEASEDERRRAVLIEGSIIRPSEPAEPAPQLGEKEPQGGTEKTNDKQQVEYDPDKHILRIDAIKECPARESTFKRRVRMIKPRLEVLGYTGQYAFFDRALFMDWKAKAFPLVDAKPMMKGELSPEQQRVADQYLSALRALPANNPSAQDCTDECEQTILKQAAKDHLDPNRSEPEIAEYVKTMAANWIKNNEKAIAIRKAHEKKAAEIRPQITE